MLIHILTWGPRRSIRQELGVEPRIFTEAGSGLTASPTRSLVTIAKASKFALQGDIINHSVVTLIHRDVIEKDHLVQLRPGKRTQNSLCRHLLSRFNRQHAASVDRRQRGPPNRRTLHRRALYGKRKKGTPFIADSAPASAQQPKPPRAIHVSQIAGAVPARATYIEFRFAIAFPVKVSAQHVSARNHNLSRLSARHQKPLEVPGIQLRNRHAPLLANHA